MGHTQTATKCECVKGRQREETTNAKHATNTTVQPWLYCCCWEGRIPGIAEYSFFAGTSSNCDCLTFRLRLGHREENRPSRAPLLWALHTVISTVGIHTHTLTDPHHTELAAPSQTPGEEKGTRGKWHHVWWTSWPPASLPCFVPREGCGLLLLLVFFFSGFPPPSHVCVAPTTTYTDTAHTHR